jgi:hypothetical protein
LETKFIGNLSLYFDTGDEAAAKLVESACARSLELVRTLWGLDAPAECRVYVMTSWPRFLFHSAPWPWRIYLAITLPLRYARIRKTWGMAGGWALRYGPRRVIGVKPPRLLQDVNSGLGERFYARREVDESVQHNTCHELVHACTDHLRLPTWLHEGLAMVTADRLAGKPTVRADTLRTLAARSQGIRSSAGRRWTSVDREDLLYWAARSYWITRYLAEAHPGWLRRQLGQRQSRTAVENELAIELGTSREQLWRQIDGIVVSHFEGWST